MLILIRKLPGSPLNFSGTEAARTAPYFLALEPSLSASFLGVSVLAWYRRRQASQAKQREPGPG